MGMQTGTTLTSSSVMQRVHAPAHKGTGQKYTVDGKLLGEVAEVAGT